MPDISKLGELCAVLDMSVDELLGGEMAGVIRKVERRLEAGTAGSEKRAEAGAAK